MIKSFLTSLKKVEGFIAELDKIDVYIESNRAFYLTSELIQNLDFLTKISRQLPFEMGINRINGKDVYEIIDDVIVESSGVKVDYIKEGWLGIRLPALPPKRKQFHSRHLFEPLNIALREFFDNQLFLDKRKMVLCCRFVYSNTVPLESYLDYDNLELKMLTDVIASHTTMTDAPYRLNSYCCSAQGEETHMEIFLILLEDFPSWLEYEKLIPKKGVLE